MTKSRSIFIVCSIVVVGTVAAAFATESRAGEPATRPSFEDSARSLGSSDARLRDQAMAALRAAGRSAESALRAAAASGDPEVARRARALLLETDRPAPPELPEPDSDELDHYRNADHASKAPLIPGLLNGSGGVGNRAGAVVRLWAAEDDEELRSQLFQLMLKAPAPFASALVARGEMPAARRLLETALAPGDSPETAEPYAALCLIRGDLDAAIAKWSAPRTASDPEANAAEGNAGAAAAAVLVRLQRAAGHAREAVAAARRAGDPSLYEDALLDAGDWPALAGAIEARPIQITRPRQLGTLAGAFQLAGDAKGFDDVIARMRKLATPGTIDDVAYSLLLAGRADDGIALLADGAHDVELFKLLVAREEWERAWALVKSRDGSREEPAVQLRVAAAGQLQALGDSDAATTLLARVVEENRAINSPTVYSAVAEMYREAGKTEEAWANFRSAMRATANKQQEWWLVARQAFKPSAADDVDDDDDDGSVADDIGGDELWLLSARRAPDQSVDERFDRARALAEGKVPLTELLRLTERRGQKAERARGDADVPRSDAAFEAHVALMVARRIRAADGEAKAIKYLSDAADDAPATEFALQLYVRLGDWAMEKRDYAKAAEWYARAWNCDRSRSGPLYLRAAALGQAGWTRRAAELADLALAIPLADSTRRYEAVQLLHRRRMTQALTREVNFIQRTVSGDVFAADLAMRLNAEEAARAGDWLAAANWHERSLLNFMGTFKSPEPVAHLRIPHTLHRERARGLLAKGDAAGGEREIAVCRALLPGDVMLPIDVVPELERRGLKARADELYTESKRGLEATLARYPNSANDHNNLAWLAANCGREADAALAHARRAVALRPKNAAYIDTLAEVQFRRGEFDDAIKSMKRCVSLQPKQPRHREQLERFEAGKRGEQRPMPPE